MPTGDAPIQRFRFADLTLDLGQRRVWRGREVVTLPTLSYEFLRALVEAAPNLVTHEEMARRVWGPRRIVTHENLTQRLAILRNRIGDSAAEPRYIESVRGQGFRLIPEVARVELSVGSMPAQRPALRILDRRLGAALGVLGIGVIAFLFAAGPLHAPRDVANAAAEAATAGLGDRVPRSIAVLPFAKLNDEPEPRYFAEAMHAEIVNDLGKTTDLNVIARASVLHYAGSALPIGAIADELRVETVAQGTVSFSDDVIHVVMELVDATSGVQLWTESYDAAPDDLFAVQRRVTSGIAAALGAGFSEVEAESSTPDSESSALAYAYYLRAMDIFNQDNVGTRPTAQTFLDQAIALAPGFSYAYAGKAVVHAFSAINSGDAGSDGRLSVVERERLALDYADRALALDPETDLAYYALGVLDMFSWRWEQARNRLRRAVAISPQHATFLAQLGWLEVCGFGDTTGLRRSETAARLDPQNAYVLQRVSDTMGCAGDTAGALTANEQALGVDPTSFGSRLSHAILVAQVKGPEHGLREFRNLEPLLTEQRVLSVPAVALAYARLGAPDDARRLVDRFRAFSAIRSTGPGNWYLASLAIDDFDTAYDKLAEAIEGRALGPGFYTLVAFLNNPGYPPPFDEPRFLALRERLRSRASVAR